MKLEDKNFLLELFIITLIIKALKYMYTKKLTTSLNFVCPGPAVTNFSQVNTQPGVVITLLTINEANTCIN